MRFDFFCNPITVIGFFFFIQFFSFLEIQLKTMVLAHEIRFYEEKYNTSTQLCL